MGDLDELAAEARARGISYGQLMSGTTARERQEIIEKWTARRAAVAGAKRAEKTEQAPKGTRAGRKKKK